LLARLEGGYFLASRAFEIHREPQRPYQDSGHTGSNILASLKPLLVSKLLKLDVVS